MATDMVDTKKDKSNNVAETPIVDETPIEEVTAEADEPKEEAKAEAGAGKSGKAFGKTADEVRQSASKTFNEAIKQVENLSKALGSALQDRSNVVMVRINNDALLYLDMMVEADVAKSRSEAAAFLINEGIKTNEELFHKIRDISDQISALKAQLRTTIKSE